MLALRRRLAAEALILAALALGSCSRPAWESKLDVADVNARNALYRISQLESRVEELERKLR